MKSSEIVVFAKHLRMLMDQHGDSQTSLAKKSGVSQKTISNIINPNSDVDSPRLDNFAALARTYGVDLWKMLIPTNDVSFLTDKKIDKIILCYKQVRTESRENIARIAENEVRYCIPEKEP